VKILYPRIGKGGYSSEEFLEESPSNQSLKSGQEELSPKTLGSTDLFALRSPVSVQSVGSGEVSLPTQFCMPAVNERLAPFIRCIQLLEIRTATLDDSLPLSFGRIRGEMNLIWNNLEELHKNAPSNPREDPSRDLFQSRGAASGPTTPLSLSEHAFQHLMSQVVDELRSSGLMLQSDLDSHVNAGLPPDVLDQILGLSNRVSNIERDLTDPEGTLARLEGRIKALEDRRAGDAIEHGGKTFHDLGSVAVWLQTFQDKNLYRDCVDMVTLIMLCAKAYETIAEGMATAAAAHKAEYNSLTEAQISLSYGLTYPENLMKKMDKQKHAATGGWYWTTSWSTFSAFKGTFNMVPRMGSRACYGRLPG
jgi:hypothetical protein